MPDLAGWFDDLADWMAVQGIGVLATSLFQGQFPALHTEGVLLVPTGGPEGRKVPRTEYPTLQVTSRARSFGLAWAKAVEVHTLLHLAPQRQMGATKVLYSKALQPPFALPQTDGQLCRVVCNYKFWLT